jgi:tetratricopeptide (TPR) repeat protein
MCACSRSSGPAQLWEDAERRGDVLTAMDTERLEKAVAMRESGRVKEALREFVSLTESATDPEEKASLLLNEARCYRLLGQLAEAEGRLSWARRISPRTQGLLYLDEEGAVLQWHRGERDKALKVLDRLYTDYRQLLLTPEHRDLYVRVQSSRGMLLAELTRYGEARQLLQECLSFGSRLTDRVSVLYNLGLCSLKLGGFREAKQRFQEVLRDGSQPDCAARAHYYLGTIYFSEGAYGKALMEFNWCLPHAEEGNISTKNIYQWLASTARASGMREDAERYEELAKG